MQFRFYYRECEGIYAPDTYVFMYVSECREAGLSLLIEISPDSIKNKAINFDAGRRWGMNETRGGQFSVAIIRNELFCNPRFDCRY